MTETITWSVPGKSFESYVLDLRNFLITAIRDSRSFDIDEVLRRVPASDGEALREALAQRERSIQSGDYKLTNNGTAIQPEFFDEQIGKFTFNIPNRC